MGSLHSTMLSIVDQRYSTVQGRCTEGQLAYLNVVTLHPGPDSLAATRRAATLSGASSVTDESAA